MKGSETGHSRTILVVEDLETIRRMVCSMLTLCGYNCIEAADGMEALDIARNAAHTLDLVVTDILMPRMGGIELAQQVARLRSDLPFLFMSGYSDDAVVRTLERSPGLFLAKPFTAAALTGKVRTALAVPWRGLPEMNVNSAT